MEGLGGGKQPYVIARQDGQPMAFADLWEGPVKASRSQE
jgi:putative SOS response-associated peptidase YedK